MKPFVYQSPQNIEEAVSFLKLDGYSVLAGGSDILGEIKDDVVEVQGLVDLGKLEGLSDVDEAESEIRIGSMVNVSDVANNEYWCVDALCCLWLPDQLQLNKLEILELLGATYANDLAVGTTGIKDLIV